jgi:ribose transport system substrate-binding protein
MGYLGVKAVVAFIKGERVERRVDTGVRVVSRADMDTPEAKALLKPDLDRWLKNK